MSLDDYAKLVAGLQETLQALRTAVETLTAQLAQRDDDLRERDEELRKRDHELEQLRRKLFGRNTEKMPPKERELAKSDDPAARKARTKTRRDAAAQKKRELPQVEVIHEVPQEQEVCHACVGPFRDLGEGEISSEIEYVPGRFVKRRHVRKRRVCRCGDTIVVAPAPPRVADGVLYGPGIHARAVVAKCADSMPLERQSKALQRDGVDVSPSTLGDMFHRVADSCKPLYELVLDEIARSGRVNADETPVRVQAGRGKTRRSYMWTFIGAGHIAFHYSPSRSGQAPATILGAYTGLLQVDAYSGYNKVCTPSGWTRVGCLAHVRRYFFNALKTAPEAAEEAMKRILIIYRVEYEAENQGILGTDAHRVLRQAKSRPMLDAMQLWLRQQRDLHPPKSPMGKAISYALNAWPSLEVYLHNPAVKPDNNRAESALRAVALGRKNYLFVGSDEAGHNLAVLQTLVATCHAHGVNPEAYFADILIRVQHHPANRKRELLPDQWKKLFSG